jgi:uncharacterized short protein YbdD (DUF466 family)
MSYKHQKNLQGNTGETILRKADNALIPMVVGNRDYDEYLEWAKTNTAETAD